MSILTSIADLIFAILIFPATFILKIIRSMGVHNYPICKTIFNMVGVFPIRNHYYEPQFIYKTKSINKKDPRILNGIDWNINEQLTMLEKFTYANELNNIPSSACKNKEFYWGNGNFESGDAEYWYQLLRHVKAKTIIEIGSGYSTLMARKAIEMNKTDDSSYTCNHICIEPYEMPWLESLDIKIIREKVENLDLDFFSVLEENDILFIDSSHIIRPHGDVLFEILELLPHLKKGVIVHIHDIFTPNHYLKFWVEDKVLFWNEQYLLEAFLTHNHTWKIIGSLNYLHHENFEKLKSVAPYIDKDREPGSFYIQKIR